MNDQQKKAIDHLYGPLLVIAGAGSGKTRVVTERIAQLLRSGIDPSEILAVTFTNKAADEMRHRVFSMALRPPLISTFHSFGARFLRESSHRLGFTNTFTIYDSADSEQLLKNCLKELEIKPEKGILKELRSEISDAKNNLLLPDDFMHQRGEGSFFQVYQRYQLKLKEYSAIDFDDLILLPVLLLQKDEEVRERMQERFKFVLIDEYQDTNKTQYTLFRLLVDKHRNIFVVGDPDQSIYSWRGASIENILGFENDFPAAVVVKLEQNYRSTGHILKAANGLITHNKGRYEKNLWSQLGDGEKVVITQFFDERDEALFIAAKVEDLIEGGLEPKEIALLYRTNAQSRSLEDALLKANIPYTIVGGLSFYERKEIKDLLAYLKIASSPTDFISFARCINTPKRGLGNAAIEKLKILADEQQMPILMLVKQAPFLSIPAKQKEALNNFVNLIEAISQQPSVAKALQTAISSSNYLAYLKEDPETFLDRRENVEALIAKTIEWEEENPNGTLIQFLEEISLRQNVEENSPFDSKITLMTLHNSKGLEFTTCFVCGLEEDLLPHINSKIAESAIEEERRLLYVGMTRAMRQLFLSFAAYRFLFGTSRSMRKSRFLEEIPIEHINHLQARYAPKAKHSSYHF